MRDEKLKFEIRKRRLRTKLAACSNRPRLSVFRSNQHLYAQIIDDEQGVTLASASTLEKDIRQHNKSNCNSDKASQIGKLIGERAASAGIKSVVFDKGGYKYHGRLKLIADAARNHINF